MPNGTATPRTPQRIGHPEIQNLPLLEFAEKGFSSVEIWLISDFDLFAFKPAFTHQIIFDFLWIARVSDNCEALLRAAAGYIEQTSGAIDACLAAFMLVVEVCFRFVFSAEELFVTEHESARFSVIDNYHDTWKFAPLNPLMRLERCSTANIPVVRFDL